MTPLATARLIQVGFALAIVAGVVYLGWSYKNMAGDLAVAETRIDQAEADARALRRDYDLLSAEIVRRADVDRMIRDARQTTTIRLDEVQDEDPVARPYLGEPIPDSVRRAYLGGDEAER